MATRTPKTPPKIHPAFDEMAAPPPPQPMVAPSNGMRGVAEWRQYRVTFEVQPDGRKLIVAPAEAAGNYL